MKNIDFMLYNIIKKYDIYRHQPELEKIYSKLCVQILLNELFDKYSSDKKIALRTIGIYTDRVYDLLSDENKKKICCIVDRKEQAVSHNLPILRPFDFNCNIADALILTSWHIRSEFKTEAVKYTAAGIECVDIYDYIARRGFASSNTYLQDGEQDKYLHITHLDVSSNIYFLNNTTHEEEKKYYFELIIGQLIEMKDFVTAEKYINDYVKQGFDKNNIYFEFLEALNGLLNEIEKYAHYRTQEDVVINWIDNVNASEVYNSDFGKKITDNSYVFKSAYTVTPWTRFTHIAVMTGMLPISDETYKPMRFSTDNSEVLNCVEKNGYQYKYIAGPGNYAHMYNKDNLPFYPNGFDGIVMGDKNISECSTRIQWTALRERLLSNKPVCFIVHNLSESHSPYLYPEMTPYLGPRIDNKIPAMQYIFERVEWYSRFYGQNVHQIYMSDHGDFMLNTRSYETERTNIALVIKSSKLIPKFDDRMFSLKNFPKIVHYLVNDNEVKWDSIFSEYIPYENPDYARAAGIVHMVTNVWLTGNRETAMCYYQSRGIRTKEDMYIRYAVGKEIYYRLPDEKTNYIDDEKYVDRIDMLRKLAPAEFIDSKNIGMYQRTGLLYEWLKQVPDDKINW